LSLRSNPGLKLANASGVFIQTDAQPNFCTNNNHLGPVSFFLTWTTAFRRVIAV